MPNFPPGSTWFSASLQGRRDEPRRRYSSGSLSPRNHISAIFLLPGGETIITHLADILIIQAIRRCVDRAPEADQGWLSALRDGKALAAIRPTTSALITHLGRPAQEHGLGLKPVDMLTRVKNHRE